MWRLCLVVLLALAAGPPLGAAQQSQCTPEDLTAAPTTAVGTILVEGGEDLTQPAAAAAKPAFQKTKYRPCELKDALAEAAERVRRLFQEHGYFKAKVEDPVTRPAGPDKVDVVIAVTPGVVYQLADIRFTHATAFSAEELHAAFAMQPGDVFNLVTFSQGLEHLRRLYASKGFIRFSPVPNPDFDDENRTITWTIDLDEGAPYTLGALILDGPEPAAGVGKRLVADWQPLMGKPYDPAVLTQFLQEHAALLRLRHPDPERLFDSLIDNQDHIVNVRLNFPN